MLTNAARRSRGTTAQLTAGHDSCVDSLTLVTSAKTLIDDKAFSFSSLSGKYSSLDVPGDCGASNTASTGPSKRLIIAQSCSGCVYVFCLAVSEMSRAASLVNQLKLGTVASQVHKSATPDVGPIMRVVPS